MSPLLSIVLFALTVGGVPLGHQKRLDMNCDGIPDLCYTSENTLHCLEGNTWTTLAATVSPSCPTSAAHLAEPTTSTTTGSLSQTAVSTSSNTSTQTQPRSTLPSPSQFAAEKGSKWTIELQGNLGFTGAVGGQSLGGDKARTGQIGNTTIWNFGDMECDGDWQTCGFSMGPAFYGTTSVMTVNTDNVTLIQDHDFVQAWSGDETPRSPNTQWGMDTSNVVPVNDTHGVAFAWEAWRGGASPAAVAVDRGNAVASITLGDTKPIATRLGPLLTDASKIQLGLMGALTATDGYIYIYSLAGPSKLIVGRVPASNDAAFDPNNYSFLQHNTSSTWISGIPDANTTAIGATTANPSGQFGCATYGSVFYNNYINKYILLCNAFETFVNMYTSDKPWGPFSEEYSITQSGQDGLQTGVYGSMAHPAYGSGKEWYFSIGPNANFQVFKVSFDY